MTFRRIWDFGFGVLRVFLSFQSGFDRSIDTEAVLATPSCIDTIFMLKQVQLTAQTV
jgi:hypothetical protein